MALGDYLNIQSNDHFFNFFSSCMPRGSLDLERYQQTAAWSTHDFRHPWTGVRYDPAQRVEDEIDQDAYLG